MLKKPVSEIRKHIQFKAKIRFGMFLVLPIAISLYMLFAPEKNIFLAMITAFFPYFISIIIGMFILNRRYTDETAKHLLRFEEKFSKRTLKSFKRELLALVAVVSLGHLSAYLLNLDSFTVSFIPVIILGAAVIIFRPSIRASDTALDDEYDNEFVEEYRFRSHASVQPDNFLMNPAHPSSLLNPTNPASPTYISRDI